MKPEILNSAAATVIFFWAIWCVFNRAINDGLVGKIIFSVLAITAFANLIEPLTQYAVQREAEVSMHVAMALACIRHIFVKTFWRKISRLIQFLMPGLAVLMRRHKRHSQHNGGKRHDL